MNKIGSKTVDMDFLVKSMLKNVHASSGELFDSLVRSIVDRLSYIHDVSSKDIDEIEKLVLAEADARNVSIENMFTRQNKLYYLSDRDIFFNTVIDKWIQKNN